MVGVVNVSGSDRYVLQRLAHRLRLVAIDIDAAASGLASSLVEIRDSAEYASGGVLFSVAELEALGNVFAQLEKECAGGCT